jgi:hypothetical protein
MSDRVRMSRTVRRSHLAVRPEMNRLVSTAKMPEMEMACPACPSVMCRSEAIGVSRLTGMNSEATSTMQHSDMARTAPQAGARSGIVSLVEAKPMDIRFSKSGCA